MNERPSWKAQYDPNLIPVRPRAKQASISAYLLLGTSATPLRPSFGEVKLYATRRIQGK